MTAVGSKALSQQPRVPVSPAAALVPCVPPVSWSLAAATGEVLQAAREFNAAGFSRKTVSLGQPLSRFNSEGSSIPHLLDHP